jgi:hypothetical protein
MKRLCQILLLFLLGGSRSALGSTRSQRTKKTYSFFSNNNNPENDKIRNSNNNNLDHYPYELLQIPCHAFTHEQQQQTTLPMARTLCDTGAQRTVVTRDYVEHCGLLASVDRRYAGHAVGVGGACAVLGRLPAGCMQWQFAAGVIVDCPVLTVIETKNSHGGSDKNMDVLVGLDFLREHNAVLDLRKDELQLTLAASTTGERLRTVRIPFVRTTNQIRHDADDKRHDYTACEMDEARSKDESISEFSDDDEYETNTGTIDMSGV